MMKLKRYDKVRELVSQILEIDPNNEEALALIAKIEAIEAAIRRAEEQHAQLLQRVKKYEGIYNKGRKYFDNQEYRKALEVFSKCVSFPSMGNSRLKTIASECRTYRNDSSRLLKDMVVPELTIADELLSSGQFRESIAAYKRVLKFDYKNTNAKKGIKRAKVGIHDAAKDLYSRAAIAESVSDLKNACLLYNRVVDVALPGSSYYNKSIKKVRKYCADR
jgi:tetratricopeptide (TPR) repeat protein